QPAGQAAGRRIAPQLDHGPRGKGAGDVGVQLHRALLSISVGNRVFPAFILSQSGRAVKYTWGARRRGGGAAAEKFSLFHKKDAAFLLTAGPGSGIIRGVRKAKCLYKGAGGESG